MPYGTKKRICIDYDEAANPISCYVTWYVNWEPVEGAQVLVSPFGSGAAVLQAALRHNRLQGTLW